jgi:hypothetical protein
VQPSVPRPGIAAPIVGDASMRRLQISGALPSSTPAVNGFSVSQSSVVAVPVPPAELAAVRALDPIQRTAMASSAPSDARTQGGSRSSAAGADRGRRSAQCARWRQRGALTRREGSEALLPPRNTVPGDAPSSAELRFTASFPPAITGSGTGLLPPHNGTASNFTHPAPAQKAESLTAAVPAQQAAPASTPSAATSSLAHRLRPTAALRTGAPA